MTIIEAIDLLKTYNGPLGLTLHAGASEAAIKQVEHRYNIVLPDDFKTFYQFTDGFETVEDIFNMIPLAEIDENFKSYNTNFDIAEYMIYSDTWGLEINLNDPNDYAIFNVTGENEKIMLSKSLAEFIARFLKGGVFETGGLYAWRDEIKATFHGNTDPQKIKPLLAVFREGLKLGLISKQEIVRRADWIISTEENPDYFFIEISLSHDTNALLTVLNSIDIPEDIMHLRAILGIVHNQLLIDQTTADKARVILDKLINQPGFTPYEKTEMYSLTDGFDYLDEKLDEQTQQQLDKQIMTFLDNYAQFNLYNYKNWDRINMVIAKTFEIKSYKQDYSYNLPYQSAKNNKRILRLAITITTVIVILGIVYYFDPSMLATSALIMFIVFSRNYARLKRR